MTREWGRPISSGSWLQGTLIAGLRPVGQRVLITEDLEDVEVREGSSATFSCRISPPDYGPVQWFLDQTPLHPNELNEIQAQPGGYHVLTLRQLALKDSGTIHFEAGDQRASATLQVTGGLCAPRCGGPSPWTKGQPWGGQMLATHRAWPWGSWGWFPAYGPRRGGLLEDNPPSSQGGLCCTRPASSPWQPMTLARGGSCTPSQGAALCAGVPKHPVCLSVPPEKLSVFSRELTDATVTEGEDLTLICDTTTSDSPVSWTKDGKALRPSARCQLSQEGHRAQLVITGATLQDGGRYKCESGGSWTSSIVRVHGKFLGSHSISGWGALGPQHPPFFPSQGSAAAGVVLPRPCRLLSSCLLLASCLCLVLTPVSPSSDLAGLPLLG